MSGYIISCTVHITIGYMSEVAEDILVCGGGVDGAGGEGGIEDRGGSMHAQKIKYTDITSN